MNLKLLNRIHQIHQDLAVGKEVELLRLTKNRKVDLDLLKDIHELYYNGYLHLPIYCGVFGYQKVDPITKHFKNNHLKTLGHKLTSQLYGDQIREKVKQTNLERYGVSNVSQSSEIREKVKQTNLERYGYHHASQSPEIQEKVRKTNLGKYGTTCSLKSPKIKEKIKQTNLERYGCESPLQSPEILEKMKQTCLERYGVPYASQSSGIREKVKRTNLERYGVECSLQSPEIQEKVKRTNLERYGYGNHLQSPGIKDKIKQTNLERYGVEYALQSPIIQEKMSQTCLERYGVRNASQSPDIRDKRRQTNIEMFGFPNASQSPEIKEKTKKTNIERYGYPTPSQSPEIKEKTKKTNIERYGCEYPTQNLGVREKSKQTRKSKDSRYAKLLDLVESNSDKTSQFVMGNYPYNHAVILRRYGLYQENLSTIEIAIREILEKHKIEYWFRHRPKFLEGKELDFFIPASNNPDIGKGGKPVAIEVNGLYWHSTKFRDKFYHQDKHLRCRSEGIQLLSFTEDQILEKLEIIESMILHKLGKTPYRLYAKNCKIRELNTQQAKDFLEYNHLHGFSNASVYLGLEYQGKLVHVMSFGNNRFKKSNHPELIRSASLRFHSVAGGFQRLLKYYKKTYKIDLVESYVDFNISNGQSYELASKNLSEGYNLTEPDLWFVYRGKRYRRQMFMKHNLHKIFKDFPKRDDPNYDQINASEYLRDRGVLEYYGAGNLKYLI